MEQQCASPLHHPEETAIFRRDTGTDAAEDQQLAIHGPTMQEEQYPQTVNRDAVNASDSKSDQDAVKSSESASVSSRTATRSSTAAKTGI